MAGRVSGERVETFAPHGGQVTAGAGGVVAVLLIAVWAVDHDQVALWVPAVGMLLGVLAWTAGLRPRVWVEPGTVVLRNMLTTVHIPLAAVEEVAVRQVMAVRAGGRRHTCAGTGRSRRQALRGSGRFSAGGLAGGGFGYDVERGADRTIIYGDYVEMRMRDLIAEDRLRRGVRARTAEVDVLAGEITRTPAYLEIGLLVAAVVFLVVAVVVSR